MSVFYLLPSRPMLGERFASWLETMLPGLRWPSQCWSDLAETLHAVAAAHSDVYVVYRDELADENDPATSLADGFGAAPGDEIIEVLPGAAPARRWRF